MAATYVHLSSRDIDSAILQANGIKPKEQEKAKPVNKLCLRYKEINPITLIHCGRCGFSLDTNIAAIEEKGAT